MPDGRNEEHIALFERGSIRIHCRNAVRRQVIRFGDGRQCVAGFDVMKSPRIPVSRWDDFERGLGGLTCPLRNVDQETRGSHVF